MKPKPKQMYAWVVFYLYDDGTEYCADAIGRSKEQAWLRFRTLNPGLEGKAFVCRRVKMEILTRSKK